MLMRFLAILALACLWLIRKPCWLIAMMVIACLILARRALHMACIAVFACVCFIGLSTVVLAADAVPATTAVIPYGNILNGIVILLGGWTGVATIMTTVILMVLSRINKPLADAAKAAHVDTLISAAAASAISDTAGAIKDKTIELDRLPELMARSINFLDDHPDDVFALVGGTDTAKAMIRAALQKAGVVPADATSEHFESP
ncbi:MAG: hypothetical protein P4L82_12215 [Ancalomicrobiaceae bacterium]|nr:hypothetical protein [Ancalomicrobiaceae bacterium]